MSRKQEQKHNTNLLFARARVKTLMESDDLAGQKTWLRNRCNDVHTCMHTVATVRGGRNGRGAFGLWLDGRRNPEGCPRGCTPSRAHFPITPGNRRFRKVASFHSAWRVFQRCIPEAARRGPASGAIRGMVLWALSVHIGSCPASQGAPTPGRTRPPTTGGVLGLGFRDLSGFRPDGTPAPRRPWDVAAPVRLNFHVRGKAAGGPCELVQLPRCRLPARNWYDNFRMPRNTGATHLLIDQT
jgi:hypothetical protein